MLKTCFNNGILIKLQTQITSSTTQPTSHFKQRSYKYAVIIARNVVRGLVLPYLNELKLLINTMNINAIQFTFTTY